MSGTRVISAAGTNFGRTGRLLGCERLVSQWFEQHRAARLMEVRHFFGEFVRSASSRDGLAG